MASIAMPIAHAMTTAQRSQTWSMAATSGARHRRAVRDRGGITRRHRGCGRPAPRRSAASPSAPPHRVQVPAFAPVAGRAAGRSGGSASAIASRRARISSGMAPMMTAAEIAITVYSSHGVPESLDDSTVTAAEIDQRHGGRDSCAERREPDHRAGTQQDAVGAIERRRGSGRTASRPRPRCRMSSAGLSVRSCRCWRTIRCRRWS